MQAAPRCRADPAAARLGVARAGLVAVALATVCAGGLYAVWSLSASRAASTGVMFYCLVLPAVFVASELTIRFERSSAGSVAAATWLVFPVVDLIVLASPWLPGHRTLLALAIVVFVGLRWAALLAVLAERDLRPGRGLAIVAVSFGLPLLTLILASVHRAFLDPGAVAGLPGREIATLVTASAAMMALAAPLLARRLPPAQAVALASLVTIAAALAWPPVVVAAIAVVLGVAMVALAALAPKGRPLARTAAGVRLARLVAIALAAGLGLTAVAVPSCLGVAPFAVVRAALFGVSASAPWREALVLAVALAAAVATRRLAPGAARGAWTATGFLLGAVAALVMTVPAAPAEMIHQGEVRLSPDTPEVLLVRPSRGPLRALSIVSAAIDADTASQGQEIARVDVGGAESYPLRAGIETAEWSRERQDVRLRALHGPAEPSCSMVVVDGAHRPFYKRRYATRIDLAGERDPAAVRITLAPVASDGRRPSLVVFSVQGMP